MAPSEGSIEEPLTVLAELKRQGLVRHVGLSNVTPRQHMRSDHTSPNGTRASVKVCDHFSHAAP
jgi:aryl-alcohol dehydrogenase-like predicted oxidoreductase